MANISRVWFGTQSTLLGASPKIHSCLFKIHFSTVTRPLLFCRVLRDYTVYSIHPALSIRRLVGSLVGWSIMIHHVLVGSLVGWSFMFYLFYVCFCGFCGWSSRRSGLVLFILVMLVRGFFVSIFLFSFRSSFSLIFIFFPDCRSSTAKSVVEKACQSHRSCSLPITSEFFSNPCPSGFHKYLSLLYACGKELYDTMFNTSWSREL